MDKEKRLDIFSEEIKLIKNEKYKVLLEKILENAPDYFFTMPASTTGKYHPSTSLGVGGLIRHTKVVAKIMILLSNLKIYKFNDCEKDLLLIAAIAHDILKKGDGKINYTVQNHPELASNFIIDILNKLDLSTEQILLEFLINPVKTHMGEWGNELPKSEPQKLLHVCDYLSSKKEFEYKFTEEEFNKTVTKIEEIALEFGKYKGKTLEEVKNMDLNYLLWCKDNLKSGNNKNMINDYLEEQNLCQ